MWTKTMGNFVQGIRKGLRKKAVRRTGLLLLLLAAGGGFWFYRYRSSQQQAGEEQYKTGVVSRQTIVSSLSGSGTILPKDSYTITSMAEGEVIAADFEEGDQVSQGQVLYQIDTSSVDSKLDSANSSLERAMRRRRSSAETPTRSMPPATLKH
jgi:multidrug efflux pump subunit AcrA (membrane-fusion protein)